MSLCLTYEEIKEVTGKAKYSAQFRALQLMGIDSTLRPDGTVLVDREIYDEWKRGNSGGGRARRSIQSDRKTYPNWNS